VKIRAGYELTFDCPQPTPMLLMLSVEPAREADLLTPQRICFEPSVEPATYRDRYGNSCIRAVMPAGRVVVSTDFLIWDSGKPDEVAPAAEQIPVERLPDETIVYLLGSRYCETDRLSDIAWELFGNTQSGWSRVQAICDFVHDRITFGYDHARATRTAREAFDGRVGVCRDFAHLAVALCRCMNVPARYCTGYLGDIGIPPVPAPMDFSAWFEAYLGGRWYTLDARHNTPRIGRIVMARGRDATDVAISTSFGPNTLEGFTVTTDEVRD